MYLRESSGNNPVTAYPLQRVKISTVKGYHVGVFLRLHLLRRKRAEKGAKNFLIICEELPDWEIRDEMVWTPNLRH
jgi:hypothetical protein